MARNNQYPIMLGMTHQYAQLHFCNIEAINRMIELLQMMKELWERESEHDKTG